MIAFLRCASSDSVLNLLVFIRVCKSSLPHMQVFFLRCVLCLVVFVAALCLVVFLYDDDDYYDDVRLLFRTTRLSLTRDVVVD